MGRHTSNLLRYAPRSAGRPLIGIIDPHMPALEGPMRALFDQVVPNALAAALRHPACFVSPSPMTHDPLFVARKLDDRQPLKAGVIYDFIPYDFSERYLAHPPARHAYHTCLRWLLRYDLFMLIAHASAAQLYSLLGIADERVIVAGAALEVAFEPQEPPGVEILPRHVLVIRGGDSCKNVECAIRAHAVAPLAQATAIPLVITGHYDTGHVAAFRALCATLKRRWRAIRPGQRDPMASLAGATKRHLRQPVVAHGRAATGPRFQETFS